MGLLLCQQRQVEIPFSFLWYPPESACDGKWKMYELSTVTFRPVPDPTIHLPLLSNLKGSSGCSLAKFPSCVCRMFLHQSEHVFLRCIELVCSQYIVGTRIVNEMLPTFCQYSPSEYVTNYFCMIEKKTSNSSLIGAR